MLDELNEQIYLQIKSLLDKDADSPFDYHRLDIEQLIQETNPKEWRAICSLTGSVSEIRGKLKVNDPSSLASHVKKVQRFNLLCNLLFCNLNSE